MKTRTCKRKLVAFIPGLKFIISGDEGDVFFLYVYLGCYDSQIPKNNSSDFYWNFELCFLVSNSTCKKTRRLHRRITIVISGGEGDKHFAFI